MGVEDASDGHLLELGRGAFASCRWGDAYEHFSAADRTTDLAGPDLELLAVAAYLLGQDTASASAWGRAHEAWRALDEILAAARCAFWAGWGLFYKGQHAQAQGWFGTAEALVDRLGGDNPVRGLLLVPSARGILDEDPDAARAQFHEVRTLGDQFADTDLSAFGLLGHGQALIRLGRVDEGVAQLDQAMVAATSATATPLLAGTVYCAVILECALLFDVSRAREWTGVLQSWCSPDMVPYRGQCLVHRCEMLQLEGQWIAAMDEAAAACELLARPPAQPALGMAHYQRAELLRLRGDCDGALDAYQEANHWGHPPQPGLALLRFAQGQVETADAAIRRAIDDARSPLRRLRLLAAFVEIVLATGDTDAARAAAAELTDMADQRQMPLLRAHAAGAAAAVLLADDEPEKALTQLTHAREAWWEVGSAFEVARIRVMTALAHRKLGDEAAAVVELEAAARVFEDVGATVDLARIRELLAAAGEADDVLTSREVEVLRLVAGGSTNREIAGTLVISEKTVERHLSNIYRKLGVTNRAAATGYAYEHGLA